MQSETAQEFNTVYENTGFTIDSGSDVAKQMLFEIYERAHQHYACSGLLRLDARIHTDGFPVIAMNCMDMEAIFNAIGKFCNLYKISKIEMRINKQELDRWIAVPKDSLVIRTAEKFGFRCSDKTQLEVAKMSAIAPKSGIFTGTGLHHITHIYIPSTENKEIPIYPCEPFGVKKVDLKSSSQTDLGKAEAEPQSDPAKADPKAIPVDREAKRKAVRAVVAAWEKSKRRVFMVYRDADHLDVGRVIKAAGFDVQDWRDWVLIAANKSHLLCTSVPPRAQTVWDSFPEPQPKTIADLGIVDTETAVADFDCLLNKHFGYAPSTSWLYEKPLTAEEIERAVAEGNMKTVNFPTFPTGSSAFSQTTMKELAAMCDASADRLKYATVAQLQNPATLKALFDHLRNEGDRETLTALFRLSSAALTAIRFQEALGKTATGKPGDDKASEHF